MEKIENEIVVIGGNHHNLLGVVRTLGERGILSNIIVTNENKYAFVVKSKYIKKYKIVNEQEDEIIEALKDYEQLENKAILIPTSDYAEYVIDKNLDKLSNKFIVPNINNEQGKIIELMNKFNQYELANKYNINMCKSVIIELEKNKYEMNNIKYPCIIKPLASIDGRKSDIRICKDNVEKTLQELKSIGYKKVLIQDFLEFDHEYGLIGCCYKDQVVLPGVIEKQRIYPKNRGSVSYGKVIPIKELNFKIDEIINILRILNFSGMFDVEIFKKGKETYLNEINLRNSGNSYIYSTQGVDITYLWVLLSLGLEIDNKKKNIDKEFYFIDENLERFQLIKGNISLKQWLKARKNTSCYFIKNKKDRKVQMWKNIYAILRRIDKR